jgi:hypothetical protein
VGSSGAPAKKSAAESQGLLALAIALGLVLICRLVLYARMPDRTSDFDLLYLAAARLLRGDNPYPFPAQSFPYPLPAVLLGVPFTFLRLGLARPIFDVLVGWLFVYALWKYRGPYALLAVASATYLVAMAQGQTTPLMVAASLIPALGFLLVVKPNTSAGLWIARPSWLGLLGVFVFAGLSFALMPSWPQAWWLALPADNTVLAPPILRPLGFLLLLAAIRWRTPEGRLLLAIAFIPQTTLPYELVPLALIPANRLEMIVYVVGSWIAVVAADRLHLGHSMAAWAAIGWPVTLCAVYVPMLYLVLRRPKNGRKGLQVGKDRRRPNRLPDEELEVDISATDEGGVSVTVTHLPTQLSITESGKNRNALRRKAHDRLAATVAEMLRRPQEGIATSSFGDTASKD